MVPFLPSGIVKSFAEMADKRREGMFYTEAGERKGKKTRVRFKNTASCSGPQESATPRSMGHVVTADISHDFGSKMRRSINKDSTR
jgi:hypothetical protein